MIEPQMQLLLDTTVYIDEMQERLPQGLDHSIHTRNVWHSSVTACEMCVLAGLLHPKHPSTTRAIQQITLSVDRRQADRTVNPDQETWIQAGVLAGLLARLQQYGKAEQRRALNDALIFLSAAKAGLTVLTRNVADYDLLMQLAPQGKAIFYRV